MLFIELLFNALELEMKDQIELFRIPIRVINNRGHQDHEENLLRLTHHRATLSASITRHFTAAVEENERM